MHVVVIVFDVHGPMVLANFWRLQTDRLVYGTSQLQSIISH